MANPSDPRPAYRQVADDLRAGIAAGTFKPGDRLPSGRDLARRYGVAPMTIRQALDVLRQERAVQAYPGRGVFVPGGSEGSSRAAAAYLVRLRLLPGMTPEQGLEELRRSVRFGQPEVTLVENPDEQES